MTYSELVVSSEEMTVENDGAQLFKAALSSAQLRELENVRAAQPKDHAGVRLSASRCFDRSSLRLVR